MNLSARQRFLQASAALFSLILSASPTLPAAAEEGSWQSEPNLPLELTGLHAEVIDGRVYVVGGGDLPSRERDRVKNALHVFHPAQGSWTRAADMPTRRGFLGTGVVNRRLYAIGGSINMVEHDPGIATVEIYDPATDGWTRGPDMPTPRADLTAAAVGNRIYAIGGTRHVGVEALATVEVLDPATQTWTRKADMPTPRLHLCSAAVGGKIYVVGGGPEWPVPLATVEIYDPATDNWATGADMPTPRIGIWCAAMDDKIYVVGGLSWENEALATVEVYDTATDSWTSTPEMVTPRILPAAVSLNGRIYAIGGARTDYSGLNLVESVGPS